MDTSCIFLYHEGYRVPITSLYPHVRESLKSGITMEEKRMRSEDRASCRWIGFGITKGVTDPERRISVIARVDELKQGLHAELVSGFPDVDPFPLCYDHIHHIHGFGNFVRWVYFADPTSVHDVIGIDWSINVRKTSGIATSIEQVSQVVETLKRQGIAPSTEVALLNWRMCEDKGVHSMRQHANLLTVEDWVYRAPSILAAHSSYCPRCGQDALLSDGPFCTRCGCKTDLFRKEKVS